MVDVLLASNPVRLIVAAEPVQTGATCVTPVSVGAGLTVTVFVSISVQLPVVTE